MICYAATDRGSVRKQNEDDVFISCDEVGNLPNLFMVADGMGGHKGGSFASHFCIRTAVEQCSKLGPDEPVNMMQETISETNRLLYAEAKSHPELSGMGTTLVMACIDGDILYVANVGDSRLYLFDGSLRQITRDHSFVEEMVREGKLTKNSPLYIENKNVITRAVGVFPYVDPDFFEVELKAGDLILMCSDGLTNMVDDDTITELLTAADALSDKADVLINRGLANGGKDNLTVVLIDPFYDEESIW